MRTLIKSLLLAVTASFCLTTTVHAAEGNIAVVDFGKAIFNTNVAKAKLDKKKKESGFTSLKKKYESTVTQLKALAKKAEGKSMTWSKEQLAEHQKKVEFLRADLELTTRKLQADQQELQSSIAAELRPKAAKALQEIIKEEKIVLLLSADAVVTVAPELDLTKKLTDRLNKK